MNGVPTTTGTYRGSAPGVLLVRTVSRDGPPPPAAVAGLSCQSTLTPGMASDCAHGGCNTESASDQDLASLRRFLGATFKIRATESATITVCFEACPRARRMAPGIPAAGRGLDFIGAGALGWHRVRRQKVGVDGVVHRCGISQYLE
jgi:hypothetical protein